MRDVAGEDLDAVAVFRTNKEVGALLAGLAGAIADEQGQAGVRLAIKQFAHQPRPQKAGCACNKDEFFIFHAEPTPVRAQFEGRKR